MASGTVLRAAGLSAAAFLMSALATPAQAACDPGETELRFHHVAADRGNARGEAAVTLAERINREFDGRACMTVTPRATDHSEATLPEALAEGRFEIGAISTGSLGAISPRFLVFDLPFLFDDVEAVLAFQASATGRDLLEEAGRAGMIGLAYLLDGFDQIAAARPVTAPADLEGVRFATGGSPLDRATFSLFGAEPVGPEAAEAEAEARDGTWSDLRSEGVARRDYGLTGTNHTVEQYVLVAGRDRWRSLDPDLRDRLGLAADERVRPLHRSGSLILLERTGRADGVALPWDRDWVLTADVRAFPIAAVLGLVHAAGKSGYLLLTHGDDEKCVYFHRGEVVFAASNQRVDRLGECLLRAGTLTLAQLREAEARWTPEARLGKVLVQLGLLTPRELWNAVKTQVEEIVRSLFAYTAGVVQMWEGEIQPDNVVRLALPTNRLIDEGQRRRDELFRFLARLEDPRTRLSPGDETRARLSASETALLDALRDEGTFGVVCRRAGIDPLSGARTMQLLQLAGAVRIERRAASQHPDDAQVRICIDDHVKLLAELTAPIVALDGAAPVRERLAKVVAEAASHHPLLAHATVGPGGILDPEALAPHALRLAGDRVRAVGAALGEVVAYVEFELHNHPGIDRPELFLDAVEALRARLVG